MKKIFSILSLFGMLAAASAQEFQHQTRALNIEVPVRVFKGDVFIGDLEIGDFELFEDGIPQVIEAVYLIRKDKIERKQEEKKFIPQTKRYFYLFFEIAEYTPRIGDAVEYFFKEVVLPEDDITIITPLKTYHMKNDTVAQTPRERIAEQLVSILRKEATMGNSQYRRVVEELTGLARALSSALGGPSGLDSYTDSSIQEMDSGSRLEYLLDQYEVTLQNLEKLREVNQNRILEFGKYLKEKLGQKHIFLFYQREFIPQIEGRILTQALGVNQDKPHVQAKMFSQFSGYVRETMIDASKIKQAFSDSSITTHFLYFTKSADRIPGVHFEEHSEDIYQPFTEIAHATGGSTVNSANPQYLFQKAVEASENYYLVYYSPKNYIADGGFKNIEVKVKGQSYQVTHRAGYIAD